MKAPSVHELIAEMIPQLFAADSGPCELDVPFGRGAARRYFSTAPLSEDLRRHIDDCLRLWERRRPAADWEARLALEQEWMQQQFAESWIARRTGLTGWAEIIDYFRRLNGRTRENRSIRKNIVIERSAAPEDATRLDDESLFPGLDWLGGTPWSYFRVDEKLRIKRLDATSSSCASDEIAGETYLPNFLRPLARAAGSDNLVVSATEAGDLLIADCRSLIAARRKGRWRVIDSANIQASVTAMMKARFLQADVDHRHLARLALQLMLEMSYSRHGGLILFDEKRNLDGYIVRRDPESERKAHPFVSQLHSRRRSLLVSEVILLTELSHIDGALIFDEEGSLIDVGAMVRPHPDHPRIAGARTAAAYSAARFGATTIKVSADGGITMYFPFPEEFPGRVFVNEVL